MISHKTQTVNPMRKQVLSFLFGSRMPLVSWNLEFVQIESRRIFVGPDLDPLRLAVCGKPLFNNPVAH